ncbi:hypothetical protein ScPMuIL_006247 [Solemya velum]
MGESDREPVDLFRDTYIRYLGYANEVGESFRALVPVTFVRLSYVVASGYVVGDAVYKGIKASNNTSDDDNKRANRVKLTVLDTLIWQGLASVAIPGYTINRICALSLFTLRVGTKLPPDTRKWLTTAVGLACIPFIIKPIDRSVDVMMNIGVRKWIGVDNSEEPTTKTGEDISDETKSSDRLFENDEYNKLWGTLVVELTWNDPGCNSLTK